MTKKRKLPNPGSREAVYKGCACPVMDNNYGKGVPRESGGQFFWYSMDCPLHFPKKKRKAKP